MGEWEATVECGYCSTIIAFDIFNIPEADNFFFGSRKIEGYTEFPEEAMRAIQNEKGISLLNSIPACPRCHNYNFQDLRLRASYPFKGFFCKKCGKDLIDRKNGVRLGLQDSSEMDAWWYEVVNDDDPETPDKL